MTYQVHRPALRLASQSCGDSHHFLLPNLSRNNLSSLDLQIILNASNFTVFSLGTVRGIVMTPAPFKDWSLHFSSLEEHLKTCAMHRQVSNNSAFSL